MPRNPDLPLLKCDYCSLTTRNHFIYRRHRKRCMRENTSLSQRSETEKSTALAGPAEREKAVENVDEFTGEDEEVSAVNEKSGSSLTEQTKSSTGGNSPHGKSTLSEINDPAESAVQDMTSIFLTSGSSGDSDSKISLRLRKRSMSDLDSSVEHAEKKSWTSGSKQESDPEQEMEVSIAELDDTLNKSNSSGALAPPHVSRCYRCNDCSFFTNKSKDFLRHKIDVHKAHISIFSCTVCEYASAYKHKLARHLGHLHNLHPANNEIFPEYAAPTVEGDGSPLKPKEPLMRPQRKVKPKKVISNKAAPKSGQTLDSLLLKLRAKTKVTEASLSSLFTNMNHQPAEEGGSGEGDLYKCNLCLFTANSKSKVTRHIQACHINASLFRCNLCSYKSYSKIEFYAHKKKHTNKNTTMFKCTECAYATEFRPNFDRHMLHHGCDKRNKCSLCSYSTYHEGALKRHVTSHHPNTEENQTLVIAGDEGTTIRPNTGSDDDGDDSNEPEAEGGLDGDGFRCPICSSQYRRCADLNRHMKLKHSVTRKEFIEYNDAENDEEEEVFDIDDEEDDGNDSDDSSGDMEMEEPSATDDSDESQPLSELGLKASGVKMINKKCSYCSYIAKWPSDLRRHMRVHSVVKRFKCSLCTKKYKYLGDLNVHMRRDHEISPDEKLLNPQKVSTVATKKNSPKLFRCPACPYFTKVKVDMDRHSHEHTEEKTYSCKLCKYETYWRGDMGRHLYRKHPAEVSKDADVKQFFIFRPERRALTKGGRGVSSPDNPPDSDNKGNSVVEDAPGASSVVEEKMDMEEGNRDTISDTVKNRVSDAGKNEDITSDIVKNEDNLTETVKNEDISDTVKNGDNMSDSVRKEDNVDTINLPDSFNNCSVDTDRTGNRIYRCQLCSFSNSQAYKMKNHLDTHLNLKQFKCPVCGRRSNWKYDLRKHISSRHPNCKQDVIVMSIEEAKATIQDYITSMSSVKRDHHLNVGAMTPINTKLIRTMAAEKSSVPEGKKKRAYEYKCTHCPFRSWYRSSVLKHQHESHIGQIGVGILAKPILISAEEEQEYEKAAAANREEEMLQEDCAQEEMNESTSEKMDVDEEDLVNVTESTPLYRCAECGKEGTSKGSIKKHYNYIHPDNDVRIVSVADGVEFNYYTGLPSVTPSSPVSGTKHVTAGPGQATVMSKLSDPKKHGYVRPFKCSVCGQRSNWKWDIRKHLRDKHPGECGHVIVLQLDEARATCPPKNKMPPEEELEDLDSTDTEMSGSEKEANKTPNKSIVSPSMSYKYQEMLMGRFKRYKCSGCGYRSNWRTDICRHIERRHRDGSAEVIFMGVQEAKETFESYTYHPANTPQGSSGFKPPKPVTPSKPSKKQTLVTGRVWHCPKCKFVSAVRTHIVTHMQEHGMKPFRCITCGMMSRFRSPINRHIRKQHNSTQYKTFCKLIIKYTKPSAQGHSPDWAVGQGTFVDAYLCRLCSGNTAETSTKEDMMSHILSEHGSTDASQALLIKKKIGAENGADGDWSGVDEVSKSGKPKRYFCTICPYRTDKRGLLTFHNSYHQPSSQNKYKCKLCPYYVCAPRLLHQHMKCHDEKIDDQTTLESFGWKAAAEKTQPSPTSKRGKVSFEVSPKRHVCEKCPYTTNSKNDFLYHKQFHRPKPAAQYKCEHCDYWVTHRRLLRQHARLHGEEYQDDSITSSPSKSLASDASAVLDAVEIAAIKQKMISNKITASLSTCPAVSPMKIATQCSAGNRPGYVLRDGVYKKLHRCSKCPYTNIRSRNVRLHELMHGWRRSEHPLMKCPHCDYYVGAKGLLSHHMKVHNQQYRPDPSDCTTFDLERQEKAPGMATISAEADDESQNVFTSPDIPQRHKVDTLLEISRFKKFSCEKCPYASGKRSHFLRHMELHGSRQRYTCQYCDYSVPYMNLLQQHQRIHLMPNQNLLATQSFSNLQHLKEVPADVALASALPPTDSSESVTINVIHDHLELYENDDNNSFDAEPKKLYRCDRCPYANVRRDHLLTHLRFHLTKSHFHCPYCDYSAPKHQLLTQHIRVHFCPLPELSEWLIENGQSERAQEVNDIDLTVTQAVQVAEKYQHSTKRKLGSLLQSQKTDGKDETENKDSEQPAKRQKTDTSETNGVDNPKEATGPSCSTSSSKERLETAEPQPNTSGTAAEAEKAMDVGKSSEDSNIYICQYCDREFPTSKLLISHELQHLIGNHFEQQSYVKKFADDITATSQSADSGSTTKTTEAEKDLQHVAVGTGDSKEDMASEQEKTKDITLKHAQDDPQQPHDEGAQEIFDKKKHGGKEEEMDMTDDAKVSGEKEEQKGEGADEKDSKEPDKRYTMRRRADNSDLAVSSPETTANTVDKSV